ncbi:MAG: GNAT family N-acetyltransferase, partial [Bdellovibrionota bacterium]
GMYAFELGGVFSFPKIGYDENFRHLAPGHLIVHGVLQECWEHGLREFDFLGYMMPWKEDWTSQSRVSWDIHLYKNSLKGRLMEKIRFGLLPLVRRALRLSTEQERLQSAEG